MSLRADIEMDIDLHLLTCQYIKDFEMYWNGDVNKLPDYVDMRIWFE